MEILHSNFEYHVVIDILKIIRHLFTVLCNLECDTYIFYFFSYGILPKNISILLVDDICLFGNHRQLNPKSPDPNKVTSSAPLFMDILFFKTWQTHQSKVGLVCMSWAMDIQQSGLSATP